MAKPPLVHQPLGRICLTRIPMSPHSLLLLVASAFGGLVVLTSSLLLGPGQRYPVPNEGMEPTLVRGSSVEIDTTNRLHDTHDVIVYHSPDGRDANGEQLVGRIVATSGQLVEIVNGQVRVDGAALPEPYLARTAVTLPLGQDPIPGCLTASSSSCLIPDGMVFVLGDNRSASYDSRKFGPVWLYDVVGHIAA